nr:MAG TPA: Endoplasmic reticulum vesicle transporter [Caudoviricetes sp.]
MRYFENCKTCEDVKQLYKKYARDLHTAIHQPKVI